MARKAESHGKQRTKEDRETKEEINRKEEPRDQLLTFQSRR